MAAHEHLSDIQFQYHTVDLGAPKPHHRLAAISSSGNQVGTMLWTSKEISNIGVVPGQERRGIATALWNEGHRMAAENARVPQPKHSADRTVSGDRWARSVGGRLPRRKPMSY